ncbi:MAG TPA: SRPBCC family protein [Gemmatimonadales bacterium]|nr:SRPBCC family protein [Gemmatimonadales bacterium]
MTRKILIVLGALAALVLLVAAVGLALPREHQVTSAVALTAAPEQVWPLVSDPGSLQGHWEELEEVERLPDRDGKPLWRQKAGGFEMRLVVEESVPPTRFVTRIDAPDDATFGGRWIYQLEPMGTGTRVRITEDGWVGNPIFRVMMQAMGTHRTLDGYLTALGRKLGEDVRPEHVP